MMLAPGRGLVLEKSAAFVNLPSFLLPAFQSASAAHPHGHHHAHHNHLPFLRRQFSSTPSRSSKLGRTPISIPPGVEIFVGEPKIKKDATTYLRIPKRTVTVQGPLGKLDLEIPPFIKIDQDAEARRAVLSIENTKEKQQMEMWGMYGRDTRKPGRKEGETGRGGSERKHGGKKKIHF